MASLLSPLLGVDTSRHRLLPPAPIDIAVVMLRVILRRHAVLVDRPDSVPGLGNVWCVFDDGVAVVLRPLLHAYLGKLTLSAKAAAYRRFCILHHRYIRLLMWLMHSCFTISTSAPYGRRVLRAERTAASPSPSREVYSAFSNSTDLAHIPLAASVSIDPN